MKTLIRTLVAAALSFGTNAFAADPEVQRQINEGDAALAAGDVELAEDLYTNAKGTAADKQDLYGMLDLSDRFLNIASEYHGKDCFLIATQIAYHHIDLAPSDGDPDAACAEAVNELRFISLAWESGLIDIAKSEEAQGAMQRMADDAFDNAEINERRNCAVSP